MFAGKDFLKMTPPPGYVPGVGRGAVPLINSTRLPKRAASAGLAGGVEDDNDVGRFDDIAGEDDSGLLASSSAHASTNDLADELAWNAVDARKRRKVGPNQGHSVSAGIRKATSQFSDLKKGLTSISEQDWESLPEAPDLTRKNKRLREEERATRRSYTLPDALLDSEKDENASAIHVDRTRPVLEALIKTDPHEPQGWIGLARLEETAQRFHEARLAIEKGSIMCPNSPETWLENIRIHASRPREARAIAAKAVSACPDSLDLWLQAVNLEQDTVSKLKVVHKALEKIPTSSELWKIAAQEEPEVATQQAVLETAVELIPNSSTLWIDLIRLKPSEILQALDHCPGDDLVIATALEHAPSFEDLPEALRTQMSTTDRNKWFGMLADMPPSGRKKLLQILKPGYQDHEFVLELPVGVRQQVFESMPRDEKVYLYLSENHDANSEAILDEATSLIPTSAALWIRSIQVGGERAALKATQNSLDPDVLAAAVSKLRNPLPILAEAVAKMPTSERLWYKYVHALRVSGEDTAAIKIAREGLTHHPKSAKLHLQLHQLGSSDPNALTMVSAQDPLKPALWLAAAASKGLGIIQRRALLDRALKECSDSEILWQQRIHLEPSETAGPRVAQALRMCPTSGLIWFEDLLRTPEAHRKKRLAEAVKTTNASAPVLVFAGLEFCARGRINKGSMWFEKAIGADKSNGDAWLWLWACSSNDHRPSIAERFTRAAPTHGLILAPVLKNPANARRQLAEILELAASKLINPLS